MKILSVTIFAQFLVQQAACTHLETCECDEIRAMHGECNSRGSYFQARKQVQCTDFKFQSYGNCRETLKTQSKATGLSSTTTH